MDHEALLHFLDGYGLGSLFAPAEPDFPKRSTTDDLN
jgi:hypothetical protein